MRSVVEDDARQSALAAALIHRAIENDESLFVSDVVVCELVWVLSVAYQFGRPAIATLLRDLFRARHLQFAATDQLVRALHAYQAGKGDFADYLVREQGRHADCESMATFDKVLLKERGFVPVR